MPEPGGPAAFVITVEGFPGVRAGVDVSVHSPWRDPRRIAGGTLRSEEQAGVRVPASAFLESPETFTGYPEGVVAVWEGDHLARVLDRMRELRNYRMEFAFEPGPDATDPVAIASLGFPVSLVRWEQWPEALLREVLNYYLQSPALESPIEPFFSLSAAIARQRAVTLWDLAGEVPGTHYFVDGRGRVTLSRRWAERGRFFITADETADHIRDSAFAREIGDWRLNLFASQAPCAFCPHYRYCAGYWTTADNAEAACRTWRKIMDTLVGVYRQAARPEER